MVGIDIIDIARVTDDEKFLERIANENEIAYITQTNDKSLRRQRTAALFSMKESVMKALGVGLGGLSFKDIELYHKPSGQPAVNLKGEAEKKLQMDFPNKQVYVSLSHIKDVAVTIAIIQ